MIRHLLSPGRKNLSSISSRYSLQNHFPQNPFKRGEKFTGTVLTTEAGGGVVVSAKGAIFRAYSKEPLSKGQLYQFLVSRDRPKIELKVISRLSNKGHPFFRAWAATRSDGEAIIRILAEILTLSKNVNRPSRSTISKLEQLVHLFTISHKDVIKGGLPDRIAMFLTASGIFLEAKLGKIVKQGFARGVESHMVDDLKAVLLRLLGEIEDTETKSVEMSGLAQKATQLLQLIEAHQILNLYALEGNVGWFWFVPFYEEGKYGAAELLTKKRVSGGYTIWISITLSRLGRVQAKLDLKENTIDLVFYLEQPQVAQFISDNAEVLKRGIESSGLRLGSFVCHEAVDDQIALHLASEEGFGGLHVEV